MVTATGVIGGTAHWIRVKGIENYSMDLQLLEAREREATLAQGFVLDAYGLKIEDPHLDLAKWKAIGLYVFRRIEHSAWALGDWLVAGGAEGRRWAGEGVYKLAQEITGYSKEHLSNAYRVAMAFPPDGKRQLSWAHHKAALQAPAELRASYLTTAAVNGWTAADLNEEIGKRIPSVRRISGGPRKNRWKSPQVECPAVITCACGRKIKCGNRFPIKGHKVSQLPVEP